MVISYNLYVPTTYEQFHIKFLSSLIEKKFKN